MVSAILAILLPLSLSVCYHRPLFLSYLKLFFPNCFVNDCCKLWMTPLMTRGCDVISHMIRVDHLTHKTTARRLFGLWVGQECG